MPTAPETVGRADWAFDYDLPEIDFAPEHFVSNAAKMDREPAVVDLTGTTGQRGRYFVVPTQLDNGINWIDASGYVLANSIEQPPWVRDTAFRDDFELRIEGEQATVRRVFTAS